MPLNPLDPSEILGPMQTNPSSLPALRVPPPSSNTYKTSLFHQGTHPLVHLLAGFQAPQGIGPHFAQLVLCSPFLFCPAIGFPKRLERFTPAVGVRKIVQSLKVEWTVTYQKRNY